MIKRIVSICLVLCIVLGLLLGLFSCSGAKEKVDKNKIKEIMNEVFDQADAEINEEERKAINDLFDKLAE